MFRILLLLLCFVSLLRADLPQKIDNVEIYVDLTLGEIRQKIDDVMKIPLEERTFNNTIMAWDEIGTLFFAKAALLKFMENGDNAFQKMCLSFNELIGKKEVQEKLLGFIESAQSLKPSEKYYLRAFKNCEEGLPFTVALGAGKKDFNGKMSVVNWNVCCLPGAMPLLFEIQPWEKRMNAIICFLKKVDADVICLQEVFDSKAAHCLHEALKEQYAVFYYNISPRNLGLNPQSIGLSSGLFIASKYPIEKPKFEKFDKILQPYIDRGFFSFEINGISFASTHLEASLKSGDGAELSRKCQLEQILKTKPSIICGDLNIAWGKNEPAEALFKPFYADPYNDGRVGCTFENCTHCDFCEHRPQILDYFLVSKENKLDVKTEILSVGVPDRPQEALSDHHLEFSTIVVK